MRNARIVPGSHPKIVKRKTRHTEPHPLSITASGGKMKRRTMRMTKSIEVEVFIALIQQIVKITSVSGEKYYL